VAIRKITELHASIDPEAAQKIKSDRFVDDITSGGTAAQVARFVGHGTSEDGDGTMPRILSQGALNLKVIVTSGEADQDKLQKLGNCVLGVPWNATSDTIPVDLASKFQKFLAQNHSFLTMKLCLSITHQMYDPLGLVSPVTIRFKVAYRNLFRQGLNLKMDDPIPPEDYDHWMDLIRMVAASTPIHFPRATKPHNAVGKSQLICYFDGSDFAFATILYIRWCLKDGSVFTTLVNSKSCVTPLHRISTPRSELNGAVLATRLVLSTLRSLLSSDIPETVWFFGDSECTLASIEKVNGAFGEYFGNRIGEIFDNQAKIEELCPVGENGEWWAVDTKDNGADMASHLDSTTDDLRAGSVHQNGPAYLHQAASEWPKNRNFAIRKDDHIPQGELLKKYRSIVHAVDVQPELPGIDKLID
jgi:hypothetical protein